MENILCQECLKELEPPFETERGLCHLCNVKTEVKLEEQKDGNNTRRLH